MAEVCYGEDLSLLPSAGKLSEYEKRGIRVVTRDTLENTIPFMSLRDLPHLDDGTLLEIDEAIGRLQTDCIQFVKQRGYAGKMYTPVAIVLNSANGWCMPRHLYSRNVYRTWGQVPYGFAPSAAI